MINWNNLIEEKQKEIDAIPLEKRMERYKLFMDKITLMRMKEIHDNLEEIKSSDQITREVIYGELESLENEVMFQNPNTERLKEITSYKTELTQLLERL